MRITELEVGRKITVNVSVGENSVDYDTSVVAVVEGSVLVDAMRSEDDKLLDFSSSNLTINVYAPVEGEKPLLFQQSKIRSVTYKKNVYHQILSDADAVAYNRRRSVRVFVGADAMLVAGEHKEGMKVIVRDVSCEGYAFVLDSDTEDFSGLPARLMFDDEKMHLDLHGKVVRKQKLENGKVVYGCQIDRKSMMIERYVSTKQRQQLGKKNGK